ncbi:Methyltransferase domain-containing protein [Halorientalis persicus]|uniref:Methyltransferase domain-containing protein n=1 Tax=Halorientalis persicus TaxID=1367881 RepID=A0A1H8V6U4_9EURY|nr:class I SAM-dependent methyltransferase [Halorientalis persicus]SEP10498.1 Methyltransferase domain-containing protein [Halorientalis persicus]
MNEEMRQSREFYQEYFSEASDLTYDNQQRYEILHSLVDEIPLDSTASVIDIGSGSGRNTTFLSTRFEDVMAIDITEPPLMEETIEKTDASFAEAALPYLPFKSGTFDLVVCSEVIEHIPERSLQLAAIEEITRLLTSGGWLVISTPNPNSPYSRIMNFILNFAEFTGAYESADGQLVENWIPPQELKNAILNDLQIKEARGSYYSLPGFNTGLERTLRPISDAITERNLAPNFGLYQYYIARNDPPES